MRVLARIVCAALALLLLLVAAVAVVLPRLVDSAAVREQLAGIAATALGRRPEFQQLDFRPFPPALVLEDTLPAAGDDSAARPQRIELVVELAPLFAGVVVVDHAVVEDVELRLVRTADGLQPDRSRSPDRAPVDLARVALRHLTLRNANIALEDRSVAPPVHWQLIEVEADAVAEALDAPVRVDLAGKLVSGGRVAARGRFIPGGDVDFGLDFEAVEIGPARPYFESDSEVAGVLSGSARVGGSTTTPTLEVDAALRGARMRLGDISLRGSLEVDARVDDVRAAPHGRIDLDATRAELSYAQFFTKPPGTAAAVVGVIGTARDGSLEIESWKFAMDDLDARVPSRSALEFRSQ